MKKAIYISVGIVLFLGGLYVYSHSVEAAASTESFTGATATLADPPWTNMDDGVNRRVKTDGSGNGTMVNTNRDSLMFWSKTNRTFTADQYTQYTAKFNGPANGSGYLYLIARASGTYSAGTYYWFWTDGGSDTVIRKVVAGVSTNLDSANSFTFSTGDIIKLEVVGTTIKVYKNGTAITWTTSGTDSVTDSSISSGQPGMGGWGVSGTVLFDDWQGDDVVSGGGTVTPLQDDGQWFSVLQ